jgi:hypothetical protein
MSIIAAPSLSAAVSRPAAKKIQTFRRLCPLPHTRSHWPMPSDHRLPSWFAPQQTIFYTGTKPTFRCRLLADVWSLCFIILPPSLSALISNSSKNEHRTPCFGACEVNIFRNLCSCVCAEKNINIKFINLIKVRYMSSNQWPSGLTRNKFKWGLAFNPLVIHSFSLCGIGEIEEHKTTLLAKPLFSHVQAMMVLNRIFHGRKILIVGSFSLFDIGKIEDHKTTLLTKPLFPHV